VLQSARQTFVKINSNSIQRVLFNNIGTLTLLLQKIFVPVFPLRQKLSDRLQFYHLKIGRNLFFVIIR
jgi:hypothetical protein